MFVKFLKPGPKINKWQFIGMKGPAADKWMGGLNVIYRIRKMKFI